jgi:hypothetical protein
MMKEAHMKKTILVVLLAVMIATPCFAQEIETDGLFSLEGTEWRRIGVAIRTAIPPFRLIDDTVYFTDRSVQTTSGTIGILEDVDTYLDFLVFSVAWEARVFHTAMMILQPAIGVGVFSGLVYDMGSHLGSPIRLVGVSFGVMFKIDDDDWGLLNE